MTNKKQYGVKWQEFNKSNRAVTKERFFATEDARTKFVEKVEDKDNFFKFVAWTR